VAGSDEPNEQTRGEAKRGSGREAVDKRTAITGLVLRHGDFLFWVTAAVRGDPNCSHST
jgi:hypothetical protein